MTEAAEFRDYFVLGGLLESKQETWKSKSSWEAQTCSVLEGTLHHLPQTAVLSQAALSVCLSVCAFLLPSPVFLAEVAAFPH